MAALVLAGLASSQLGRMLLLELEVTCDAPGELLLDVDTPVGIVRREASISAEQCRVAAPVRLRLSERTIRGLLVHVRGPTSRLTVEAVAVVDAAGGLVADLGPGSVSPVTGLDRVGDAAAALARRSPTGDASFQVDVPARFRPVPPRRLGLFAAFASALSVVMAAAWVAGRRALGSSRLRELAARVAAVAASAVSRHTRLVAAVVCSAVVVVRAWDRLRMPDLWAEDGRVFLAGALAHPWASLVEPYQGYFHTLPRVLALVVAHALPVGWIPVGFFVASAAVLVTVAVLPTRSDWDWLLPRPGDRLVLSLAIVLAPGLTEVTGNLTNLHWLLFVGALLVLVRDPRRRLGAVAVAFVALAAFSAGETVALLPFAIWRVWAVRRSGRLPSRDPGALVAAVVLLAAALVDWSVRAGNPPGEALTLPAAIAALRVTVFRFFVLEPLVGRDLVGRMVAPGLALDVVAGLVVVALLGVRWWHRRADPGLVAVAGAAAAAVAVAALTWIVRPGTALAFAAEDMAPRYLLVPGVAALVAYVWSTARRAAPGAAFSPGPAVLLGIYLVGLVASEQLLVRPYSDFPAWQTMAPTLERAVRDGEPRRVDVPIAPEGWVFTYEAPASR